MSYPLLHLSDSILSLSLSLTYLYKWLWNKYVIRLDPPTYLGKISCQDPYFNTAARLLFICKVIQPQFPDIKHNSLPTTNIFQSSILVLKQANVLILSKKDPVPLKQVQCQPFWAWEGNSSVNSIIRYYLGQPPKSPLSLTRLFLTLLISFTGVTWLTAHIQVCSAFSFF